MRTCNVSQERSNRRSGRVAFAVLLSFGLAVMSGCGQDASQPGADVGGDDASLYQVGTRWPKNYEGDGAWITVCYRTPGAVAGSADEQARIDFLDRTKHAVRNTWGRVAHLYFDGWNRCGANTGGQMAVNLNTSGGSASNVGYRGASAETTISLDISDTRQPVVAVHEFGHALGFHHEFTRPDWSGTFGNIACTKDADCTPTANNYGGSCVSGFCRFQGGTERGVTSAADVDSVMAATYGNNRTNGNTNGVADPAVSLSPYDVVGVREVYGSKPAASIVGLDGFCMNVSGGTAAIGSNLIAWPCVNGANSLFTMDSYRLKATIENQARCLNVYGGTVSSTDATPVVTWDCNYDANEQFKFEGVMLRTMGELCVAATGTTAGSELRTSRCGSGARSLERWDVVGRRLRLSGTNQCVTLPGSNTALGTKLQLAACGSTTGMQDFQYQGGVINFASNRCFNALGGTDQPGQAIGVWDGCSPVYANEFFHLTGEIHSLGQCADMWSGAAEAGYGINMYSCHGGQNQEWDYYWP